MTKGLTQNQLKLFAVAYMVIDHVGAVFFPDLIILRIIGRMAFPIFSYGIFEGMLYTGNPVKYMRNLLAIGLLCLLGYYIFAGEIYGNIMITLFLSAAVLSGLRLVDEGWAARGGAVALGAAAAAYFICRYFPVDYGFWGVMLPVFPAACRLAAKKSGRISHERLKNIQLSAFALGLCILALDTGWPQFFALLAIIPMAAASGERGRHKLKSFFYIFYPAHLAVIGCISMIIVK